MDTNDLLFLKTFKYLNSESIKEYYQQALKSGNVENRIEHNV